jgi:hypothetical protein
MNGTIQSIGYRMSPAVRRRVRTPPSLIAPAVTIEDALSSLFAQPLSPAIVVQSKDHFSHPGPDSRGLGQAVLATAAGDGEQRLAPDARPQYQGTMALMPSPLPGSPDAGMVPSERGPIREIQHEVLPPCSGGGRLQRSCWPCCPSSGTVAQRAARLWVSAAPSTRPAPGAPAAGGCPAGGRCCGRSGGRRRCRRARCGGRHRCGRARPRPPGTGAAG